VKRGGVNRLQAQPVRGEDQVCQGKLVINLVVGIGIQHHVHRPLRPAQAMQDLRLVNLPAHERRGAGRGCLPDGFGFICHCVNLPE